MDELVLVRSCESEDEMTIKFHVPSTGRQRNMCRKKDEPVSKPLERIRKTISSAFEDKKSKKKGKGQGFGPGGANANAAGMAGPAAAPVDAAGAVSCTLVDASGKPVPESTANSDAWQTGYALEVKYTTREAKAEMKRLKVEKNLPTCKELSLPTNVMADMLTAPSVSLEFCSIGDCGWSWYVEEGEGKEWCRVGGGAPEFKLGSAHVGKRLKVVCEPRREGRVGDTREAVSEELIADTAALSFTKGRHAGMQRKADDGTLRVMTYNILADVYAKTDYAKNVLYPEISERHLSMDYRKQLALFEVCGFENDIVCMQEVDAVWFDKFWSPRFELKGFAGFMGPKTSRVEGAAMFWNEKKLTCVSQESVHICNLFANQSWLQEHLGDQVAATLLEDKNLSGILAKLTTVVQFALFDVVGSEGTAQGKKKVLVANTHLYFHPGASHIRTLSVAALLAYAADLLSRQNLLGQCSILVCGDLNSEPDTSAIELLANGSVSMDHYEWRDCATFTWKNRDDDSEGFEQDEDLKYELKERSVQDDVCSRFALTNPFGKLASSDGLRSAFTNYVKGYIGALDYIFYTGENLKLEKFAALPVEKDLCGVEDVGPQGEVLQQRYLPSQCFPSDHVSLVADFSLNILEMSQPAPTTWPPPQDRPVMPLPASRFNEAKAAEALRQGKIIGLPTDTIYGVAAAASSDGGIDRIYDAKQRPASLPLALCISRASEIGRYGDASHLPAGLVEEFLPGPYTLLLNKREDSNLSKSLNPNTRTVGIRVPEASFIRGVVANLGFAIALTSANISGQRSSTAVGHFRNIWDKCANVYDGGQLNAGTSGSTIIDLSEEGRYKIVRPGCSENEAHEICQKYKLLQREASS